jgi:hypothetical protein
MIRSLIHPMISLSAIALQQERMTVPFLPYSPNESVWRQMSQALHVSFYRVFALLIGVLPGILAFFVALVVFAIIGKFASWIMRAILSAFHFDARVARTGAPPDWTPATSPTAIAVRVTFWVFVFLGLLVGVSAFDTSYAFGSAMSFSLLPYITRSAGAIVLLIVGTLIARFLARSVLIGAVNAQVPYARFISLGVKWLVLVLTAAMVLAHLEVGGIIVELAFSILFGGIVLTLALAVGLGSRHLVSRSIETQIERVERTTAQASVPPAPPEETIGHF